MRRSPPTYVIGRSPRADIVFEDATVSRLHAELVRGRDGTWYLTDRGSTGGTFLWAAGRWNAFKQDYIGLGDRLRFGTYECRLDDLLRQVPYEGEVVKGSTEGESETGSSICDDRPKGPVRRDPITGDVIPANE